MIRGGLLALAIGSLPAVVLPNHLVMPPGGCPAVFGQPMWTDWLFCLLIPSGLLAAVLSAGAFMWRARQSILVSGVFALVGGIGWIVALYLSLFALPPPC